MGDRAAPAVPDVTALLEDRSDHVRRSALSCLGQIGPPARSAVPRILPFLEDANTETQSSAVGALRGIRPSSTAAVEKLTAYAATSRTTGYYTALSLLGEQGKAASGASAALLRILKDPFRVSYTRTPAALALARIDPDRARKDGLAPMKRLLATSRTDATLLLALVLTDPRDWEVRAALELALKDQSANVRGGAAQAVGYSGTLGASYLPRLRRLLAEDSYYPRAVAAAAIWRITGDSSEALPVLRGLLQDRHEFYARSVVAYQAAELGANARPLLPDLKAALKRGGDPVVLDAVRHAIPRIEEAIRKTSEGGRTDDQ
jgi:HEAT repeat protein